MVATRPRLFDVEFARRVKEEKKITFDQMAEVVETSNNYLRIIFTGKHEPSFSVAVRIAKALGVSVSMLAMNEEKTMPWTCPCGASGSSTNYVGCGYHACIVRR